jgi:hypothetical protein
LLRVDADIDRIVWIVVDDIVVFQIDAWHTVVGRG